MTKPKLNDKPTSHYNDMLLALIPIMLCATVLYGGRVLLICATGFAVARAVDVWVAVMRHKEIDVSDKSSAVAAITFCMLLPVSIPLYVVAMTVALVTLVGKHIFGGKDVYPFSLAALSMCVAAVNWPEEVFKAVKPFSQVAFWSGVSQSTISGAGTIKMGGLPYISNLNLILGNYAGPMGASFVLIIFAVAVFLMSTKRITWHIPVSFLLTCCAFSILFPRIYGISVFTSLKFEMLSGALIFSAIFMLNEPATTPKNPKAKIAFGILVGLVSMLFRYFGSYEIGVCFALLLVNATEGFVDRFFERGGFKTLNKKVKEEITVTAQHIETSVEAAIEGEKTAISKKEVHIKHKTGDNKKKEPLSQAAEKVAVSENDHQSQKAVTKRKRRRTTGKNQDRTSTLDIISQAEDSIDEVSFSTQTVDMEEALRVFDERYNKGGK